MSCTAKCGEGGGRVLRKYLRQAAVLTWAGAGLSVLAESSNRRPFWPRMESALQDHIPDAGTEIWEG